MQNSYAVQYGSHEPHVALEHTKYRWSELRCAVSVNTRFQKLKEKKNGAK